MKPSKSLSDKPALLPPEMIVAFVLVTSLFALWGFANDITNPLVRAFKEVFLISNRESSLVQTAFYGGYFTMAIPAAIFIRKFSYKSGILLGLTLYATGALLFIPASISMQFWLFLLALYILTFGLAFLETTANPYILAMGDERTATQRLNFAQAFNPIGSLAGMFVASHFILASLGVSDFRQREMEAHPEYETMLPGEVDAKITAALKEYAEKDPESHQAMQANDLKIIRRPYVTIAVVVIVLLIIFGITKLPQGVHTEQLHLAGTFERLIHNRRYIEGVIAQTFYVGAQIMCWTFIIHYAMGTLKMTAAEAQKWNMVAMGIFCASRFICTFLLKFFNPGQLLMGLAMGGIALTLGTIFVEGKLGLYCLVGISACMSLMFPTIYGIALTDLGEDAKLGSAGLIMAIVGGALMPYLQGSILDLGDANGNIGLGFMELAAVRASFVLPLICFVVIAIFGYRTFTKHLAPNKVAAA